IVATRRKHLHISMSNKFIPKPDKIRGFSAPTFRLERPLPSMPQYLSTRSTEQLQRLALLLLINLLCTLNGLLFLIEFRVHRKDQQSTLANQATLVSSNLELHIRTTHQILEEIVAQHGFLSTEQLQERMQSLANAMPIIRGIGVLDSRGFPLGGTRLVPQGT